MTKHQLLTDLLKRKTTIGWLSIQFDFLDIQKLDNDQFILKINKDLESLFQIFDNNLKDYLNKENVLIVTQTGLNGYKKSVYIDDNIYLLYGGQYSLNKQGKYISELLIFPEACYRLENETFIKLFDFLFSFTNTKINRIDFTLDGYKGDTHE